MALRRPLPENPPSVPPLAAEFRSFRHPSYKPD